MRVNRVPDDARNRRRLRGLDRVRRARRLGPRSGQPTAPVFGVTVHSKTLEVAVILLGILAIAALLTGFPSLFLEWWRA